MDGIAIFDGLLIGHLTKRDELVNLSSRFIPQPLEAANKGMETSQSEGLLLEASYFGLCAATEDKKEGTTAFLEKRRPQFRGR